MSASITDKNWQNPTIVKCTVCNHQIAEPSYDLHIQTAEHQATIEHFKDKIDFENLQIFSSSLNEIIFDFLNEMEQDFTILMNHLLSKFTAVLIDFSLILLCQKSSSVSEENNNVAEIKYFYVSQEELTKNINLHKLYIHVVNSLMIQCEEFKMIGWSLESVICLKIAVVKELLVNEVVSKSLVNSGHDYDDETGSPIKTEPLRISLCELCNGYVNQNNYKQHSESTSHKISLCFKNDNILFNFVKSKKDCIFNCRFSQKQSTIIGFFNSISKNILDLINCAIQLQNNKMISLDTKIFILYTEDKPSDKLGVVKTFSTRREILAKNTDLSNWIHNITYTLNVLSQEHLKSLAQPMYYFDSVVFFDIYFYEVNANTK